MASNLPPEMIESILLYLPVKSLLRFKSVSKSWNAIVSDPIFVRNQHHQNSKAQNLFLRRIWSPHTPASGLALVELEDGKLQSMKKLKLPDGYSYAICCYCEYGLLLLSNTFSFKKCLLWNPSTKTTKQISLPLPYNGYKVNCSGLCYDPATDDFKVVFLYHDLYAVYSLNTKSWSNIKQHPYDISSYRQPTDESSGVSIDGAIYWLFWGSPSYIVYYDARDDKLKNLQMPEDVVCHLTTFLVNFGGHSCMYEYARNGSDTVLIWRKEKGIDRNTWKEVITIHNVDRRSWKFEPLCFSGNKIVMELGGDRLLLVYNPLDKTFEQVEEKITGQGSLFPYRDTLYILT